MTEHTKSIKMYGPRDYAAIVDGEPVSYHDSAITAKAAADAYVYGLLEMEAREADMAHDVQQAATDSDVVAALADADICTGCDPMDPDEGPACDQCVAKWQAEALATDVGSLEWAEQELACAREYMIVYPDSVHGPQVVADLELRVASLRAVTLPEYPAFLYYDRHQGGVVYAGSDTAYPSYIEAALARDGK